MQELVVVTTCDVEYNDTLVKVEAEEVVWHLEGYPWVVDLCKKCRDETPLSRMDDIVRAYGRPWEERLGSSPREGGKAKPKGKPEVEGPRLSCPHPACVEQSEKTYKNRGSLSGHFRDAHGESLASWEAEQAGLVADLKCGYKNCRRKFHTPQARASHRASAHGLRKEDES